jgi:AcrR family transcriptional regulator
MPRPKRIEDDALMQIARRVFVRDGPHGSTREIAAAAGISEAALFKRYPTKTELFLAAMIPPDVDADTILAAGESAGDPEEALVAISEAVLAYLREALPVIRQLMQTPLIDLADIRRRFGAPPEQRLTAALIGYLARQAEAGRIACPNPPAAAMLLFAALHSLVLFEMMDLHAQSQGPAAVRGMVRALWDGLDPTPTGA